MKKKTLKRLVAFCDGDQSKVEQWLEMESNKEVSTIEELKDYEFKKDYCWIIGKDECVPNFRKVFIEYYFQNKDYFNKYEVLSLDMALDLLSDLSCEGFGDYGLGESGKKCLGVSTQEDLDELIELVKRDLIKLKFGGMAYDW